jgi:hypothetical protein
MILRNDGDSALISRLTPFATKARQLRASFVHCHRNGVTRLAGAAVRQTLRHALIAAADGRLDQFTGSGPVLKLGALREF